MGRWAATVKENEQMKLRVKTLSGRQQSNKGSGFGRRQFIQMAGAVAVFRCADGYFGFIDLWVLPDNTK
jgi:hypothetical protein